MRENEALLARMEAADELGTAFRQGEIGKSESLAILSELRRRLERCLAHIFSKEHSDDPRPT